MAKLDEFGRPPVYDTPGGVAQINAIMQGKKPPPKTER